MSLYAFHLGQIISTVLGQVDHDGGFGGQVVSALAFHLWAILVPRALLTRGATRGSGQIQNRKP